VSIWSAFYLSDLQFSHLRMKKRRGPLVSK